MNVRNAMERIRSRILNNGQKQRRAPGVAATSRSGLVPFDGYDENRNQIRLVDPLSDSDLNKLNNLLDWKCFVADSRGRRFGNAAWQGKRCEPQAIPDRRILSMNAWFDLSDKHVLEIGCFEGIHTIALSQLARRVTAVDSRIENVVKTIVRSACFDVHPTVFKCDVEATPLDIERLRADVVHHVGVLYHLQDPVAHLLRFKDFIRLGIMLDTHYAQEAEASETYQSAGREFRYKRFQESGHEDPFSGMYDHSKWLLLGDIISLLKQAGFERIEIVEERAERNGPRVLLFARND
jgi:2-polyprenyl-3-methyl-5-hydroxy-6-metoxy-1,4-benzoquinol methylase